MNKISAYLFMVAAFTSKIKIFRGTAERAENSGKFCIICITHQIFA